MILFSYPLDEDHILMPAGIGKPILRPRSRMTAAPAGGREEGVRWNSYNNTSFVDAFVHTGTHVDTGYHVSQDGVRLRDFSLDDFVFDHPVLLEIEKQDGEKITLTDLRPHERLLRGADLLLVYTGFSKLRGVEPDRYSTKQPGFSTEAAEYLVSLPRMRCVGADTMGIENIPEGRAATPPFPTHRAFLLSGKKFLILEDPNLAPLLKKKLRRAFVIPLLFPEAEAMMVTAFAETA